MSPELTDVVLSGLRLAAFLCAPVAGAALLASALTGALQRLTAWQEPLLGYVARLGAVVAAWTIAAPWIVDELLGFARKAWGGGGG